LLVFKFVPDDPSKEGTQHSGVRHEPAH
jgi:hypothetical protein